MKWRFLWPPLGVLLVAVGLQWRHRPEATLGKGRHLTVVFAAARERFRELPVGVSEGAANAVEQALRFDDVLYREYWDPAHEGRFTLYIAYWNPGKIPVQLVASHTPDRCWTEAGWIGVKRHGNETVVVGGLRLKPAQARIFKNNTGQTQQVLYWHLVGRRLYDYGSGFNQVPSIWRWWREAAREAVRSPPEQYFVRLSSDRRFDELEADPAFRAVIKCLADLGLRDGAE